MTNTRLILSLGGCLLLGISLGCGGGGPKLGTVQGKITFDGEPLSGALVTFYPEDGRPSTGTTDERGEYRLSYKSDTPGAVVGKHTVRITTALVEGEQGGAKTRPPQEVIPDQYNTHSELTADVKSGKNTFDFQL